MTPSRSRSLPCAIRRLGCRAARVLQALALATLLGAGPADACATPVADDAAALLAQFAHLATRDPSRARELLRRLAPQRAALDPAQQLTLAVGEAELATFQWRLHEALAAAGRALALAEQLGDHRAGAGMIDLSAKLQADLGNADEALALSLRAVDLAEQLGEPRTLMQARLTRADLYARASEFEQAYAWHERAEAAGRALPQPEAQALLASARGYLARLIDDPESAAAALAESQRLFLADANPIRAADDLRDQGQALLQLGRAAEALAALSEAEQRYLALRDDSGRGTALAGVAVAQARLGRLAMALRSNDRALALLRGFDLRAALLAALTARMEILLALQQTAAAGAALQEALLVVDGVGELRLVKQFRKAQAGVLAALGRHREAFAALQAYDELQQRHDARRLSQHLAAQRGRLESQRLQRELELLQREKAAGERALAAAGQAARLQWLLLLLAILIVGYAMAGMWRRVREHARLAATDSLTGMLNRRRLFEVGSRLFERCRRARQPFAVAMLDLDHFKRINDRYGHAAGDRALQAVAAALKKQVRTGDLVARYGGEEFVVLLPGADAAEAQRVTERLRAAIAALSPALLDLDRPLTMSGGLALAAGADGDFPALVQRADAALYRAKQAGRDRIAIAARPLPEPALAQAE